ncbi:unnamed protein product [Medioppia subpectinata]|uniref:Peptidase C1A papain C-terminal domain-containing protein n=1 Tax=Medioppia subpectinata TaxID=1979941 RepID=A0A7R9KQR4_9ACAR|nr:unnamed protein product [Medioppia subpectinata]CAG2107959.1 unnamed protein product [Medioppia subpectinata]
MKRQIAEGKFDPKTQITVSEQNMIDCSGDFGTIGCDGGMPQQAFKYVAANKGINGVDAYPYLGKKDKCNYNPAKRVDVEVKEGKRLKSGLDNDLATAIYNYGPVAIAVHVTKDMAAYNEQNMIDCSGDFGTIGCDGGMPQQAFKYVAANKGINGVDAYPYLGKKDKCNYNPAKRVDVEVKEGKRLKSGLDNDLATAIYNYGPVAIAVHVTKDMAAYKSGIFDDAKCSPKKVNHAVVAVGYHPEYFIVRNSWGAKWGEDGYIRISRSRVNNCGVSQQGYYPVLPNAVETQAMRDRLRDV